MYTVRGPGGCWLLRAGRQRGRRSFESLIFCLEAPEGEFSFRRLEKLFLLGGALVAFGAVCRFGFVFFFPLSLSPFRSSLYLLILLRFSARTLIDCCWFCWFKMFSKRRGGGGRGEKNSDKKKNQPKNPPEGGRGVGS